MSFAKLSAILVRKQKGRLLLSRLLWCSGLCRFFSIRLAQGPRLRFFPTSVSASLWVDPGYYAKDGEFLLCRLREGDTFVDVGANIGHLTLLAAQRVGPSGTVVAIEPHPRTFAFLRKNVQLNGFKQVRAINAAAGNHVGQAQITDFRTDDMNHLESNRGIKVPLLTLDSLGIERRVNLLKIDTEGFEPYVLEGATHLLQRVDCVYFECSEWNLNRYGRNSWELIRMLESAGFEIFKPFRESLMRVDGDYDASAGGNLVAVRKQ